MEFLDGDAGDHHRHLHQGTTTELHLHLNGDHLDHNHHTEQINVWPYSTKYHHRKYTQACVLHSEKCQFVLFVTILILAVISRFLVVVVVSYYVTHTGIEREQK